MRKFRGMLFGLCLLLAGCGPGAERETSVTEQWLGYFSEGNYRMCDTLSGELLMEKGWTEDLNSPDELYNLYDGLRECVTGVELAELDEGYEVSVELLPYKEVDDIILDESTVYELGRDFANDSLLTYDFNEQLDRIFKVCFDKTVFAEGYNGDTVSGTFYLIETDGKVYGTKEMLTELFKLSNIYGNLEVYQNNAKQEILRAMEEKEDE